MERELESTAGGAAGPHRSRGAATVEFAFVFPILFLLVYGVIVYSYVFVLQQSMTYAVQLAADAAVKVDPKAEDASALRAAAVRQTVVSALSWLPEGQRQRVIGTGGERVIIESCPAGAADCPSDSSALRLTLRFNLRSPDLFPVLDLYIVGRVPPLPESLSATAIVRI
ncbi:MAG: pilus assembly protein [Nevskiales bacterium]|nr:pilus assembly protein [Nevskiales bacterium]